MKNIRLTLLFTLSVAAMLLLAGCHTSRRAAPVARRVAERSKPAMPALRSHSTVKVLLSKQNKASLNIKPIEGAYVAISSNADAISIADGSIKVDGEQVVLSTGNQKLSGRKISIKSNSDNSVLKVGDAEYEGILSFSADNGKLHVVNEVDRERYIAAVAVSEMGTGHSKDLYYAFAICARTYYYRNIQSNKYGLEDYEILDNVNDQCYNGRCTLVDALRAADSCSDMVMKYHSMVIEAYYHANSGGELARSQDVFSAELAYLQGGPDKASIAAGSLNDYYLKCAHWEEKIPLEKWKTIIAKVCNGNCDINNWLSLDQPTRNGYWNGVKLSKLRSAGALKSTFFNVSFDKASNTVILKGHGYGHGLGLSQQGAIWSIDHLHLSPQEVLLTYYPGVVIEKVVPETL